MSARYDSKTFHKLEGRPLNSSIFQLPKPSAIPIVDPVSRMALSSSQSNTKVHQAPARTSSEQGGEVAKAQDNDKVGKSYAESNTVGPSQLPTIEWPKWTEASKHGHVHVSANISTKQKYPDKRASRTETFSSASGPSSTTDHQLVKATTILADQSI